MSDVTATEVAKPTAPDVQAPAQETDWKAEARKWEARAKENGGAAAKLAEIEEANKTEAQKLQDQLATFQERAASAERDRERLSVIAKHGIPAEFHDLVQGADADALEASASKVKSLIQANAEPAKSASFVIPDEGGHPNLALNGDGLEAALKKALGIN